MGLRHLDWQNSWIFVSREWTAGIALFVVSKLTDLLTTIAGLKFVDGLVERNPVGAWFYTEMGVAGLILASVFGVSVVVAVVEWARSKATVYANCSIERRHLYLISYLPLTCVYTIATVHNTILVLQQLD
jgi:hypothetical protein